MPAMDLISRRVAVRTGVVPVVIAIALAGCSGPARPTVASPAASVTTAAAPTPSSSPALPPDKDPTKPQYRESQMGDQIGGPTEFQTFHTWSWDGAIMRGDYSFHCNGNGCTDHVVPLILAWTRKAGAPGTEFTARKLYSCISTSCATSFPRGGFTVQLTASVVPDNTFTAQPGDLLYVAGVTIRPT
jgi:hypothetical protein